MSDSSLAREALRSKRAEMVDDPRTVLQWWQRFVATRIAQCSGHL